MSLLLVAAMSPLAPLQAADTQGSPTYRINPGDSIQIYVWGDERLQRNMDILPDGSFTFPLVGRVVAQGLTPAQVSAEISKGLASQYHGEPPEVTVSVSSTAGFVFSVIGRVRSAGIFKPGRYVNLIEAIALAGGPDEFANLDNVTILRKTDKGLTAQRVRISDAMKGKVSGVADIPEIHAGDTVIVP